MLKKLFLVIKEKSIQKISDLAGHFLISGKHREYAFLIFVLCFCQIKNYLITEGWLAIFFNAPCKRVTFSVKKRKHHKFHLLSPLEKYLSVVSLLN